MATYRIPVKLTLRPRARNKAVVAYWYTGTYPAPTYAAAPGARVVTVQADSHAQAYRKLLDAVRPGDARPIMGRQVIKHFRQDDARGTP